MKFTIMLLIAALWCSSCTHSKTVHREGTVIGKAPPVDADDLDDLYLEVKVNGRDTIHIPVDSSIYVETNIGDTFEGDFVSN